MKLKSLFSPANMAVYGVSLANETSCKCDIQQKPFALSGRRLPCKQEGRNDQGRKDVYVNKRDRQ